MQQTPFGLNVKTMRWYEKAQGMLRLLQGTESLEKHAFISCRAATGLTMKSWKFQQPRHKEI